MILVLAYCAILLSFASGLLALVMNQRALLVALSNDCLQKYPHVHPVCQEILGRCLNMRRFPHFIRQAVFVTLGLSGVFAVLAGLSVLIGSTVLLDQVHFGLPWMPWHIRFDGLSGFFYLIIGIALIAVSLFGLVTPRLIRKANILLRRWACSLGCLSRAC